MLTLLLALFALTLFCIDTGNPIYRLGFLVIFIILYFYKKNIDERLLGLSISSKAWKIIRIILVLCIVFRLGHGAYRLLKLHPNMEDIAHVHVRAFHTLFIEHKNPYSEPIDHYFVGTVDYSGLKYPPLGLFFYAPFIAFFSEKGIYLGNFLLYFFAAFLIGKELYRYSRFHCALGLVLFFSSDFYFRLAMNRGTNDFLPSLLMLLGVLSLRRSKENTAGVYFGLSLLAKQFPVGLLLFMSGLQKNFKSVFIATFLMVIGLFPFLFWDAKALYDNMITFNLLRPVRESSILYGWSYQLQNIVPYVGLSFIGLLAIAGNYFEKLHLKKSWFLVTSGIIIFLLSSKMTPYHYFVWLLPFLIFYFIVPSSTQK